MSCHDWVQLPSGLFVSDGRIQSNGKMLSLYGASAIDVTAFNKEATKYNVHIDNPDAPIDRLVKYSMFLARRDNDGSAMPTNRQYVDMVLDTAAAKANGTEPLASFYDTLTDGTWDVVREVLEFQEKLPRGKYKAILLRFNEDGEIEPVDDVVVAGEGWVRAVGVRHGYPIETSSNECFVENLDVPNLLDGGIKGYWYVGSDLGQQKLSLRGPRRNNGKLLVADASRPLSLSDGDMGALRVRGDLPEYYRDRIAEARTEARRIEGELTSAVEIIGVAQKQLGDIAIK